MDARPAAGLPGLLGPYSAAQQAAFGGRQGLHPRGNVALRGDLRALGGHLVEPAHRQAGQLCGQPVGFGANRRQLRELRRRAGLGALGAMLLQRRAGPAERA